jgi:hypothetical protein
VNRVDESLRPVRAYGLLEDRPLPSITESSSGELSEEELAHDRDADEQSLISSLLNQALGAPGAFHAGHLITRHLGGSFARHNMVPMTRKYNAWGTYKKFERELDQIVAAGTERGPEVIYNGRVYADIRVVYPRADQDDEVFRDLLAPDAVQEMLLQDRPYYDFLKSLCLRVPASVELVELKKWLPFPRYDRQGRWLDVRAELTTLPQSASPRSGGPAHYITKSTWRSRRALWGATLPSPDLYGYKAPETGSGEAERRMHAQFSFGQVEQNQARAVFVFGPSRYEEVDPRSDEAKSAGRDVVAEYASRPRTVLPRPARIQFGRRIDPALEDYRRWLYQGVSLEATLKTKTIDEIKAEASCAADAGFMNWLHRGSDREQIEALRLKLATKPVMTLIAAYEAGQPVPV